MAQVPMDAFEEGTEIVRVYLAATLREARAVEDALSAAGVDFGVEVAPFPTRTLLGSGARQGAGFWVAGEDLDRAADALERAGQITGLVER